jgi:hypothetical protein
MRGTNNNNVSNFLKRENVSLLWEVIMDDETIRNKQPGELSQINEVFNTNLKKFYDSSGGSKNLTEMNKNYITVMMNFINNNFANKRMLPSQKKELVTYEDIQSDRLSQFEKDYNNRQQEFSKAMALPVPTAPNFSDKIDEPLSEIEAEVKRYMAQRNYDVDQLNKTFDSQETASNWLKPQETSLKAEKMPIVNNNTNSGIKHIKIDKSILLNENVIQNDVIDLSSSSKKKSISWAKELDLDAKELDAKELDIDLDLDMVKKELPKITTRFNELKNEINALNKKIDLLNTNVNLVLNLLNQNKIL